MKIFGAMGRASVALFPHLAARIDSNIRLVEPEMGQADRKRFVTQVFKWMGRNAFDFLRLSRYDLNTIRRLVRLEGAEHVHAAAEKGRGVICLGAHAGCWELIPFRMRAEGFPVAVVYRRLSDPYLDRFIEQRRRRFGIGAYERDTAGRDMLRALRRGALLGVLIDQNTRVESVVAPFMGVPARTPIGAIRVAARFGIPVLPLVIRMEPDGTHTLRAGPEIDLLPWPRGLSEAEEQRVAVENASRCNESLCALILEAREQWVWFHDRWGF